MSDFEIKNHVSLKPTGEVTLNLEQFTCQTALTDGMLREKMSIEKYMDQLRLRLSAFVLSEDAGPVVKDVGYVDVSNFPRWIPQWLQKRWTRRKEITLQVTPKYIYPTSSIKIPNLGEAVKRNFVEIHYP